MYQQIINIYYDYCDACVRIIYLIHFVFMIKQLRKQNRI